MSRERNFDGLNCAARLAAQQIPRKVLCSGHAELATRAVATWVTPFLSGTGPHRNGMQ
jgi:hypothetical protein